MERDPLDPKTLVADAYAMPGLSESEARSIFLDWALSVDDARAAIPVLLERHGAPDHPMTAVLREGLGEARPARRGGRAARRS
ncbi:hypothetical protein [Jannaschia sp. W003]|uniref:hypothetical protein n=1 Tax=Jannaschia sp. W003 TaxID=2867012 RepID=UPI0021A7C36C|nr:hypothetical protein [Jannaschia sp. W003]UWQ20597.1 hypothetical protein K3554_11455 [Jannaschia sp. W003]